MSRPLARNNYQRAHRREAHLLHSVVESEHRLVDLEELAQEGCCQGQGEIAVGDGVAIWALPAGDNAPRKLSVRFVRTGPRPGASSAACSAYVGVQDGQAVMVDAPHGGAELRVEPFPATVGARWGDEVLVGATTP
ncbi:MAG: hypothetical protein M0035_00455 [Actinomycetota bacterium]|nr:hypothetical protein [Actinomycetota bacterium]